MDFVRATQLGSVAREIISVGLVIDAFSHVRPKRFLEARIKLHPAVELQEKDRRFARSGWRTSPKAEKNMILGGNLQRPIDSK